MVSKAHLGKLIFGILLVSFGIWLVSACAQNLLLPTGEPTLPQGLPNDVPNMLLCTNEKALPVTQDTAFVTIGEVVKIEFNSEHSINNLWTGSNATFTITSPELLVCTTQTRNEYWGDGIIVKNRDGEFYPWLTVSIVKDTFTHKWINATAQMEFTYPASSSSGFVNMHKFVQRNITLYVVTPDDAKNIETYNNWKYAESIRVNSPWAILIFSVVFVLPGALLIRYAYQQRKKTAHHIK